MVKKTFAIWILILLMPTYAYAWCSSPMAPSVPSNWNKPTRPMKPSVPFCVNEWNNTHTCDEWTISSYNNDVSFYNTQLQRYNNEVEECDIILHFAASVGVKNIVSSPHQTLLNNIESTIGALDIARQSKSCRAFIFISTSEVYGEGQHRIDNKGSLIPFSEHDTMIVGNLDHLRWSYPAAKAMDEFLVKSFCEENNINYAILRPFNISGPRQTGEYGMVIPKFVDLALTNKDIHLST